MSTGRSFGSTPWKPAFGLLMLVALGWPGNMFAGEPAPSAARWVGPEAVLYLELPKPGELFDRLNDERLRGPLLAIPSLKAAMEGGPAAHLKMVAEAVSGQIGAPYEKTLRDLTAGGAVFAVEAVEGQLPGVYVIVTPSDPALLKKANATLIEMARKDAAGKGQPDPVRSIEYRGVTGYAVADAVVWGIVNDRLLIANRAEIAKTVVDRALDAKEDAPSVATSDEWKALRSHAKPETLAWGHAKMERLRQLDPARFGDGKDAKRKPPEVVLFGGWLEAIRKAPALTASIDWTAERMGAAITMPVPKGGRPEAFKAFVPPKGAGAPSLIHPPGTIASVGLWRDLSAAWDARADLVEPEEVQNLAKLDGVAGQFFGGRDFGSGVLGALSSEWRLVVALQDFQAMEPVPTLKLPAFALVIDVKPGDEDFADRLRVAFQSFIGLVNLGASQTKAPPLELRSETVEGVTIATSRWMPPKKGAATNKSGKPEPVDTRFNFSPSAFLVGNHFVISSGSGLARDLVKSLNAPAKGSDATLQAEADGSTLAKLVDMNRDRLVMQNMIEKGQDKGQAEGEVGLLASLLRYLGQGKLSVVDTPAATELGLDFKLGK